LSNEAHARIPPVMRARQPLDVDVARFVPGKVKPGNALRIGEFHVIDADRRDGLDEQGRCMQPRS
jgi:hypothetical protein